jgi:hypothetical protein
MSRSVNVAHGYTTPGIITFLPIAFGLGVSAWVSSLARSSINIIGDCTRCGGGRVAER